MIQYFKNIFKSKNKVMLNTCFDDIPRDKRGFVADKELKMLNGKEEVLTLYNAGYDKKRKAFLVVACTTYSKELN